MTVPRHEPAGNREARRIKVARSQSDVPLDLDMETAPDYPSRQAGLRAYVGGVLYVEGIVVFTMGFILLTAYWPPITRYEEPANPISLFGLWMAGLALLYMVVVGIGIFVYNFLKPGHIGHRPRPDEPGAVKRARRYASMKRRTRYIFDNTIRCETEAEEAIQARDLY